eukprot:g3276.t1
MRIRKRRRWTTATLCVALVTVPVACGIEVGSTVSCSLSDLEYLDISSLECVRDGTGNNRNKVPDVSSLDLYGNAVACTCADGFIVEASTCSAGALQSGACSDDNGAPGVLLETDQGGEYLDEKACGSCAEGTFVFEEASTEAGVLFDADPLSCQACPDENMAFGSNGQCSCIDGYTIVGASALGPLRCVDTSYVTAIAAWRGSSASTVTYRSVIASAQASTLTSETVTSLTLEHLYTWAGASCYSFTGAFGDGLQACQTLGNLCALQLHSSASMACSLFSKVLENRLGNNHGQTGWGVTLPWLSYIEEAPDVRDGTDIQMQLTFASEMRIVLAKYSLDGTWRGLEELSTQPYYCGVEAPDTSAGGGESRSTKYLKFGHSMTETFECNLRSLLGQEVFFYDPYIVDEATGELHPIAVLNVNYGGSSVSGPNLNLRAFDELDDVFTRRFFFFDSVSGITDASSTTSSSSSEGGGDGAFVPEVLRYATSIRLTFKIREDEPESIYPPILEVTYAEVKPALWDNEPTLQQPTVTFTVEYTMDTQAPRYMYQMVDWALVIEGLLLLSHTFVLFLFPFTFFISSYFFVFFKLQQSVFVMLPANREGYGSTGEYFPLELMVMVMFIFQEGELNPALRFANVTFWWCLLCGVQWLVAWGVTERYVLEQPELRFVDLATMAKVSVLILDEKYHGWYLHCRSPYPRADVTMEIMSEQLDKEEAGLTTDRGLEGCVPGLQAFELFITTTFRKKYDKVYRSLLPPSGFDVQARMAASHGNPQAGGLLGDQARALGGRGARGDDMGRAAMGALRGLRGMAASNLPKKTEKTVAAARELNGFLQGFVEQSFTREELTRSYREPLWWDRLIGTPPSMRQVWKS